MYINLNPEKLTFPKGIPGKMILNGKVLIEFLRRLIGNIDRYSTEGIYFIRKISA